MTWNTAHVTPAALRKLLDADHGCDLTVLVRDNASTDGTVDAIARQVPEARIDVGTENLGFAAGVNSLMARSTSPWLFVLNPDAWPLPGAIGNLVRAGLEHPRAAAVAPRLEHPDGRLQHSSYPFPSVRLAATVAFRWNRLPRQRADDLLLEGAWMHDRPRIVDWAFGAALLLRREAIESVGGFDERFFMYAEDLEWCWRAHRKGWHVWFEPSAVVRHVANVSGQQRFGSRRTRAHVHNALRFFAREHGILRATAWWALTVAGVAKRWLGAAARRERDRERYWRREAIAHLAAPVTRERRG